MQLKFSFQFVIGFMAAVFVLGQLHELAHLITVYLITGKFGHQADFNLWTLCDGCETYPYKYLATMAGPIFSYLLIWAGYFMLKSVNKRYWSVAILLILGNLPFARLFTAAMGKGDETTVLSILLPLMPILVVKILGFILVFCFSFPPLLLVFKRLKVKHRLGVPVILCLGPMLIMMAYEFKLLALVIKSGFLAQSHILGVSDFIYIHTVLMAAIVIINRDWLIRQRAFFTD